MAKKYAPDIPDAKWHRPGDTDYFRELLQAAKVSQRKAGDFLGINERSVRYTATGERILSYAEQYLLEVLADKVQQGEVDMNTMVKDAPRERVGTVWTHTGERPIARQDVGKMIVGYDRFRAPVHGTVQADGFGVYVQDMDGIDVHRVPVAKVVQYTLLDPPVE